ncbi:OmpA family protein [Flavobacterium sp. 83]|uniref:OmpA family protein n=1 Tax=Flavobacterium sp. 83 TaxID=1131812 RepID=UPI00054EB73E|nr:OmpA family protein [Flavobacterium sp. 83]
MKKINILLFVLFVSVSISGQNKGTKAADKLFKRFEYVQATQKYLALIHSGNSDGYIYKQLGDCYYFMNNSIESEKWYSKALKFSQVDNIYFYRYAQVLKSNKKYDEANEQMIRFSSNLPNDSRAIAFTKDPNYLSKLNSIDEAFEIKKIDINTKHSDFGGVLYKNALYFVSSRNEKATIYGWNNEPFLDIYQSNFKEDGTFAEPVLVKELNTKYHEGPVSISRDGNTVYFSTESLNDNLFENDKVNKLKFGQVYIYKATRVEGKWTNITSLSFNSKSYSTSNPSIDSEGKYLYFSSNMPGSIGGMDIWKVAINSDGTYGDPKNLGDKINTDGDEAFPYITDENILYFSSKGLTGFGGYDIFSSDLNINEPPVNVGKPVNSEKDDFAFSFNNERNLGFLSSNRDGSDDIFSAKPIYNGKISLSVKNAKDGIIIPNSKVLIQDKNKTFLDTKFLKENSELLYNVQPNTNYILEIYKDGFVTKSIEVSEIKRGTAMINVLLDPIEEVVVRDNESIILNPIYFEFNKSDITNKAINELDKLVYVMSQNDQINIFVKSHTDSRGSDAYNLNLSQKRAKSTVQYVISKGISNDRISGKGFGESEPKINCKKDCTADEYSLNRRSEFMIVKKL